MDSTLTFACFNASTTAGVLLNFWASCKGVRPLLSLLPGSAPACISVGYDGGRLARLRREMQGRPSAALIARVGVGAGFYQSRYNVRGRFSP